MVRIRYALAATLVIMAGWLAWQGYSARWQPPEMYERLGATALDWGLAGLGASCYARAGDNRARQFKNVFEPARDRLIRQDLIHDRMVTARILAAAGHLHAALAVAERAHRTDPADPRAEALMWRLRYLTGARIEAKRKLTLLADGGGSPEARTALGACLVDEGTQERAEKLLRGALDEAPRLAEAWLHLARSLRSRKRRSDAISAATKARQSADMQPAIRNQAREMLLQMEAEKGTITIAGQSVDYYRRAGVAWMRRHKAFVAVAGLYLVFLFWPAITSALKAEHRDPLAA